MPTIDHAEFLQRMTIILSVGARDPSAPKNGVAPLVSTLEAVAKRAAAKTSGRSKKTISGAASKLKKSLHSKQRAAWRSNAPKSVLLQPLDSHPRALEEVYGREGRLLLELADNATSNKDPEMARLISALEKAMQDGMLDLEAEPRPSPRLTPYVYPVV